MRKIVVQEFATLDGVVEDPGEWQMPFVDDDHMKHVTDTFAAADALLLGRKTYEGFVEAWPSRTGPFADRINGMPKFVASRTLTETEWNATLLEGDAVEAVRELEGNLLVVGSIALGHTLTEHDLVDEYEIWLHPVVLGSGTRLFPDGKPLEVSLTGTRSTSKGTQILTYQVQR
jgi:dihydrofolate reductase